MIATKGAESATGAKQRKGFLLFLCAICVLAASHPAAARPASQPPGQPAIQPSPITAGDDWSSYPSISADGRFVAFASAASDLVEADSNGVADIFVFDRQLDRLTRVSVSSAGEQAEAISTRPAISADGRFVAFESLAANLVPEDTNNLSDIFIHDRLTGQTRRVSVDSNGRQANGWSEQASLSGDGHFVAFLSSASNLAPGDDNGARDAFLHNALNGYTQRVSIDTAGAQANAESAAVLVTPSGRTAVFVSQADNLTAGDGNEQPDVFAYNRLLFRTVRITPQAGGFAASSSAGGQWVAYLSPPGAPASGFIYDQQDASVYAANFPLPLVQLSLSSDGQTLAGIGSADGVRFDLMAHALPGGETITPAQGVANVAAALSTDGQVIAYVQEVGGVLQVFVLDQRANPAPTYTLAGRVTSEQGAPLALVTVEAGARLSAASDRDGYFWLNGIPPGAATLHPSKNGFHFEPSAIALEAQSDQTDLQITYAYDEVLAEARLDIGMPYDHRCETSQPGCTGPFHGFAAGQCTDLVLDGFLWGADYDVTMELEFDAARHPEHFYQNRNARDAFDMWRYFWYAGMMLPNEAPYQVGDLVFFDWSGDGEVDHVALVSEVDREQQPVMMIDATGVIASNPNGLAGELPWEGFHVRSARGHARWDGSFESPVHTPPAGSWLQIGFGATGGRLSLYDQGGRAISARENDFEGGYFFDLTWEQSSSIPQPASAGARYFVVLANPTGADLPFYFVAQTLANGNVIGLARFTGVIAAGQVRLVPLAVTGEAGAPGLQVLTMNRKISGDATH